MSVIYFLLPCALLLGGFFLGGFLWVVFQGQYDELETPAHRMLLDDEVVTVPTLIRRGDFHE
jgi:cbb3-type cytochrome oxidase maturation protein